MPTDATAGVVAPPAPAISPERVRDRRALRLGLGVTVVFLTAMAFEWTFAYLAPLFAPPLLTASRAPRAAEAARLLAAVLAVMLGGYVLAAVSRQLPMVFALLLTPLLFLTFRFLLRGGSTLVALMALIGLVLPPLVAKASLDAIWDVSASFLGNVGLCVVVAWAMFALLPPIPGEPSPKARPILSPEAATAQAAALAVMMGAFTVAYLALDWRNVHTPLYIALYLQGLSLARTTATVRAVLLANVAGGAVAAAMYELVAMAPSFLFLAALSCAVLTGYARLVVSDRPWAPVAGFAMSLVTLLFGAAMGAHDADTGAENMAYRLFELGVAALYALAASFVLTAFRPAANPQGGAA
jgi:hypothetical protein